MNKTLLFIGPRILIIRKRKLLTGAEFGALFNADKQQVHLLEKGMKNCTFTYLDNLLESHDMSPEEFFSDNFIQ